MKLLPFILLIFTGFLVHYGYLALMGSSMGGLEGRFESSGAQSPAPVQIHIGLGFACRSLLGLPGKVLGVAFPAGGRADKSDAIYN